MKNVITNAQFNAGGITGTGLAWVGFAAAELNALEQWLRIFSLFGALTASVVTVFYLVKRNGKL